MSGKPKTKPSPAWGGSRNGSGRKPINALSDQQAKKLHALIKKRAKIEGRPWQDLLLDFVFAKDGATRVPIELTAKDRLAAIRLLADLVMTKQSEQSITVNRQEQPAISLPALEDDPGLTVVPGGKV